MSEVLAQVPQPLWKPMYYLFLGLGAVVSYEDWTHRRIRNHWIGLGLLACAAGLCYLLWNSLLGYQHQRFGWLGERYLPWAFYPKVLIHLFLSLTAAYTLWRMAIWPAGDAKLYILFALMTALIDPNIPGFPLLLFMVLLVNTFVPAGILFAAETVGIVASRAPALLRLDWGKWLKAKAEVVVIRAREAWPYRTQVLTMVVNLFVLFYAMEALQLRFRRLALGPFGNLVLFLLLISLWSRLAGFMRNQAIGLVAFVSLSAVALAGALRWHWDVWALLVETLKTTVNFGVALSCARILFYWFIEAESLRELRAEHLRAGVVLSDETWAQLSSEGGLSEKLGERYSDGLSEDAAGALKEWLSSRKAPPQPPAEGPAPAAPVVSPVPSYTVYHTIPFAVWIFLGAWFTISRRCNMVELFGPWARHAQEFCRALWTRGLS